MSCYYNKFYTKSASAWVAREENRDCPIRRFLPCEGNPLFHIELGAEAGLHKKRKRLGCSWRK